MTVMTEDWGGWGENLNTPEIYIYVRALQMTVE